jgi:hypothetical protein
VCSVGAY